MSGEEETKLWEKERVPVKLTEAGYKVLCRIHLHNSVLGILSL